MQVFSDCLTAKKGKKMSDGELMTQDTEKQLLEMAEVFHLSKEVRFRYFWLPQHFPKISLRLQQKKHGKAANR